MSKTNKNSIQNPHDKFFKELFSEKEEVTEFIAKTFPQDLVKKLDLDTLELDNTSYVDEELQEHFSDLVYNCVFYGKVPLKIALLFEHKSYQPDFPIHFQLLKYLLKIWEQNLSQKESLCPIIPIIIYHGKKPWEKKDLSQYFSEDNELDGRLRKFLPQFDYLITDLNTYQDEEIKQVFKLISLQTGLLLMKKIFEKQLEADLKFIFGAINELLKTEKGKRIFRTLLVYLYYASKIEKDKIFETMNNLSLEAQADTLTVAQQLILEGEEKGEEKTRKIVVENMLKNGFEIEQIANFTGISLEVVQKIQKQAQK
ncbi:MAG: Rpn family recombination-promoting nuclease/putative transposase [Microscillaceae bacterium]|jgi:predicted transposase/invertase (TIGR01784 family)|nr:Rpn family recombination-promoting nuclease/putative transposase [Microscillaceae bacterium]